MPQLPNNSTISDPFFVLASGSPRRREFMELLGLPFIVITAAAAGTPINETPLPHEKPTDLVQRLSRIKAEAIAHVLPQLDKSKFGLPATNPPQIIVLAADTIVVLADKILGKPANPADAVEMLKQLRLQPHFVYSGLTVTAVNLQGEITRQITRLHQSKVQMRPYTNAEIEAYVASGDPLDKAGAYGIQTQTFAPVASLDGCFAGVMGFPLGELAGALKDIGIFLPAIGPLCARRTGHVCCQK
jgi:septum formation protein